MPDLQQLLRQLQLDELATSELEGITFHSVQLFWEQRQWAAARNGDLRIAKHWGHDGNDALKLLAAGAPAAVALGAERRGGATPMHLVKDLRAQGVACFVLPAHIAPDRVFRTALALSLRSPTVTLDAATDALNYVTEALSDPRPERTLLERLQALTQASHVLLSPSGGEIARSGPSGWKPDYRHLAHPHVRLLDAGTLGAQASRVEHGGRLRRLLVSIDAEPWAAPLIAAARGVLEIVVLRESLSHKQQEAERSMLLNDWTNGRLAENELDERLSHLGFIAKGAFLACALEIDMRVRHVHQRLQRHEALETLREAGDELFAEMRLPALSTTRSDHVLWMVQSSDAEALAGLLVRALSAASAKSFRLGLSQPQPNLSAADTAYRQALLAMQSVREPSSSMTFSNLDPIAWVLEQQPVANLRSLHQQFALPVKQADATGKLWHTLKQYLRSPDDLVGLAAELHIHVNTLRYRLKRIETIIGQPLARPETLARLHLAERIDAMLAGKRT